MAVKRLAKRALIKEKQIEHVLSEKDILAHIDHPLLVWLAIRLYLYLQVHMYCTFQTRNFLYIVMEYVEGGEFFTYLRRSTRLDSQSARFYAAHVSSTRVNKQQLDRPDFRVSASPPHSIPGLETRKFITHSTGVPQANRFRLCEKGRRKNFHSLWNARIYCS